MERLILLLQQEQQEARRSPKAFVAALGDAARERGFLLVQELRNLGMEAEMDYEGRSLKSQMRRADKLGARHVLILGEEEMKRDEIQLRDMADKSQAVVPLGAVADTLGTIYGRKAE